MKRIRNACAAVLVLVLAWACSVAYASSAPNVIEAGEAGTDIYTIQQRLIDLGFLNYRATGNFGDITREAVRDFQTANGLPADGQIGTETMRLLFSDSAERAQRNPAFRSAVGRAYTGTVSAQGELSSWESIDREFSVGKTAQVTDYNTGEQFALRRTGGTNNAEVVTESASDAETFEYVFGGYSWEHRPVLVEIGGRTYAASLFGMPTQTGGTGGSTMSGVTFLYFNNSRSDIHGLGDEEHAVSITAVTS